VKSPYFAQPNLLAGKKLVGEYFQGDISPAKMGEELLGWLDDSAARERLAGEFRRIHGSLRCDASAQAARAIADLVASRVAT
jgi:lipid-A-disaccharide synthase